MKTSNFIAIVIGIFIAILMINKMNGQVDLITDVKGYNSIAIGYESECHAIAIGYSAAVNTGGYAITLDRVQAETDTLQPKRASKLKTKYQILKNRFMEFLNVLPTVALVVVTVVIAFSAIFGFVQSASNEERIKGLKKRLKKLEKRIDRDL